MDETKRQEYNDFVKSAWDGAISHERNYNPPHKKLWLGKINDWIVENIKETGVDTTGFSRNITNDFVVHVNAHHGDEKTEKDRTQTAVSPQDFEKIFEITKSPDYAMVGMKRTTKLGIKDSIVYAKAIGGKTFIYIEVIHTGKKNRALSSVTLFIKNTVLSPNSLFTNIKSNSKNDVTNAKIIGEAGGHPGDEANHNVHSTVATSAIPANTSLSSSTPEKSSRSADNQKTLSQITDPAERELFQLTEDEIAADAQSYKTWEEWRDASEAATRGLLTKIRASFCFKAQLRAAGDNPIMKGWKERDQ
jgi:hypothetical protein